jgi:F-type H+-transporting ATPase subunit f
LWFKMGFGDYPAEYDPKVHGPYDPARYYGKADTPLSQVKLGDLGSWLARRNKTPPAMVAAVSRAWWRWQHKYVQPKRAGIAPFLQVVSGAMVFFYVINSKKLSRHKNYKYH